MRKFDAIVIAGKRRRLLVCRKGMFRMIVKLVFNRNTGVIIGGAGTGGGVGTPEHHH